MVKETVDSSMIGLFVYCNGCSELGIEFKNGKIWAYSGVPSEVYDDMVHANSVGKSYNENIKGCYHSKVVYGKDIAEYYSYHSDHSDDDENFFNELNKVKKEKPEISQLPAKNMHFVAFKHGWFDTFICNEKELIKYMSNNRKNQIKVFEIGKIIVDWS